MVFAARNAAQVANKLKETERELQELKRKLARREQLLEEQKVGGALSQGVGQ